MASETVLLQDITAHWQAIGRSAAALRRAYPSYLAYLHGELEAHRAAFPWALLPWDALAWESYAPHAGAETVGLRLGRLGGEDLARLGDFPILAPFYGQGHLLLDGPPPVVRPALQSLLLRAVVIAPPGGLRLAAVDAAGMGATFAAFLRLPDACRDPQVWSRAEEIAARLEALERHIESVIQTRLQNQYPDLVAYNQALGEIAVPYVVLAVADFPAGFETRSIQSLLRIARNGPRAGVHLLLGWNETFPLPREVSRADLQAMGTVLTLDENGTLRWQKRSPVRLDPLPPPEQINRLLEAYGQAAAQVSVILPFRRVAIPPEEQWGGQARFGLRIPIGLRSTGEVQELQLGGEGVVHHGLIGGITRSGKSNLLHVLILQLALRYSPQELEMYLIDFKEGVEFQDYIALPHVRAVGLECEREFGRSILRHVQGVMETRGRQFKSLGVSDYAAYRRLAESSLPRLLLVMDEFQILFAEDDAIARESGLILEDIARRGAGFGIHLVLSSQSPSAAGMYGTRIFNQMALRIALRCHPADLTAILGEGHPAAALERPGEAIYNDEMGHREKSVQVRIALLEAEERRRLVQMLADRARALSLEPPVTFDRRAPARLEANPEWLARLEQPFPATRPPAVRVWLGEPVEIKPPTAATLERYVRSNLLILGGNDEEAHGLLVAALLSLAAHYGPSQARFLVADFARPESPLHGLFARLRLPQPLEVFGPRQVGAALSQLVAQLEERLQGALAETDVYLLIAGLHRWRELRSADPYTQSEPAKQLTRLAEEGPEVGIHLIIWADAFSTLERVFKRGGVGHFDLRVAFHLSEKDSGDLFGNNQAAKLVENRALFRHEDWEMGRLEKFKPYAVPDADTLSRLIEQLQS